MRIVSNVGNDRVLDILNSDMSDGATLLVVSSEFSLFAFELLRQRLMTVKEARLVLPSVGVDGLNLFGSDFDRPARNLLQLRWLARSCAKWLENKADLRFALKSMPQSMIIIEGQQTNSAVVGSCAFTTDGLGVAPSVNRRRNGTPYRLPKGTPASSCIGSARVGPGLSI